MDAATRAELVTAIAVASEADAKTRRKLARGLGHMAMQLEQAGALERVDDMDLALRALAMGAAAHSYPQRYLMSRARLMQRRRAALGLPEPSVAEEQAKALDVEAGALFLADADISTSQFIADEPTHVTMQRLGFFCVALGRDGIVKARLRVHEHGPCEPQTSEFRRLREATSVGRVTCKSGRVKVTGCGAKSIVLPARAIDYDIAAFGLGAGRSCECLLVLSPADGVASPVLTGTPELLL